uniref:Uncharacterized protein n=1 Tax=viral metagenome TaxID=1070528 RepID=A0A6C0FDA6_9ZZZZ|tara:strand:- start:23659 stop:24672 length:1014 start_codon:yes stop_codon:yes gene_type:complete
MDDFSTSGLHESKNEWGARLLTILTPHIIDGFRSILDESIKLCRENEEMDKYLMTFQNFISRIPKWNPDIVSTETERIKEKSGCQYLEDLVTCVHVIQLKILTAVRVGQKPKKVDMDIMKIDDFIHKVYVNSARQIYKNVYLFDMNVPPLQKQKNNRETEVIVQECILNTVRESIPVQTILKCYLDETTEEDIEEEVKEEDITPEPTPEELIQQQAESTNQDVTKEDVDSINTNQQGGTEDSTIPATPSLSFNDVDTAIDTNQNEYSIDAPKDLGRLEEISRIRNEMRKQDEEEDELDKISISTESVKLGDLDVHNLETPKIDLDQELLINDVEILT